MFLTFSLTYLLTPRERLSTFPKLFNEGGPSNNRKARQLIFLDAHRDFRVFFVYIYYWEVKKHKLESWDLKICLIVFLWHLKGVFSLFKVLIYLFRSTHLLWNIHHIISWFPLFSYSLHNFSFLSKCFISRVQLFLLHCSSF